jgi:hypothetical protein
MEQAKIEAIAILFMIDYLRFIPLKLQKIFIGRPKNGPHFGHFPETGFSDPLIFDSYL